MKILLVDDGRTKSRLLKPFLIERGVATEEDVLLAGSGVEARNSLKDATFDLLILDILLPWREGDDPSLSGSANLLEDILNDNTLRRPRHIVGLTADDNAARQADPHFAAQMWTILRFDETSSAWMEAIASSVEYMR
jgi:CheY-like chemotaxis protein